MKIEARTDPWFAEKYLGSFLHFNKRELATLKAAYRILVEARERVQSCALTETQKDEIEDELPVVYAECWLGELLEQPILEIWNPRAEKAFQDHAVKKPRLEDVDER